MELEVNVHWLDEVDSTNKYCIENFNNLADGTLVVAGRQNCGRGRRGRTWISPEGENIYASYIVKNLTFPAYHSSWIGSLATLDFLRGFLPVESAWLKWPNDIYCGINKISGMLCEIKTGQGNSIEGVVIGIGININMSRECLDKIDQPATSLSAETLAMYNVKDMVNQLALSLNKFYTLAVSGTETLYSQWKDENFLLGKAIEVISEDDSVTSGIIADIGRSGELIMDVNGTMKVFMSGDISIRKTPEFYDLINSK